MAYSKNITLSGIFMIKNIPLCEFEICMDIPQAFTKLENDARLWPYDMREEQDGWALVELLKDRVVPETRQCLYSALKAAQICSYDISEILKYQNASSWDDTYWVKFKHGPQTWEELRAKIGYTG